MTDVYTPLSNRTCNAPGARIVIPALVHATAGDFLVPVPSRCRLVHVQTCVTTAVGGTNDITVTVEKDAAGGDALCTVTIAASSAVGTEDIGTLTAGASSDLMTLDNQDVCVATTGSQTTGTAMVYMVFEHAAGQ